MGEYYGKRYGGEEALERSNFWDGVWADFEEWWAEGENLPDEKPDRKKVCSSLVKRLGRTYGIKDDQEAVEAGLGRIGTGTSVQEDNRHAKPAKEVVEDNSDVKHAKRSVEAYLADDAIFERFEKDLEAIEVDREATEDHVTKAMRTNLRRSYRAYMRLAEATVKSYNYDYRLGHEIQVHEPMETIRKEIIQMLEKREDISEYMEWQTCNLNEYWRKAVFDALFEEAEQWRGEINLLTVREAYNEWCNDRIDKSDIADYLDYEVWRDINTGGGSLRLLKPDGKDRKEPLAKIDDLKKIRGRG